MWKICFTMFNISFIHLCRSDCCEQVKFQLCPVPFSIMHENLSSNLPVHLINPPVLIAPPLGMFSIIANHLPIRLSLEFVDEDINWNFKLNYEQVWISGNLCFISVYPFSRSFYFRSRLKMTFRNWPFGMYYPEQERKISRLSSFSARLVCQHLCP